MVHRKVPNKLGIQDDHVKPEKSSSKVNQDGKSRGADMKKKMKKSRSINLSNHDALQSSSPSPPSRRCFSHTRKPSPSPSPPPTPPPIHVPTMDGSPNYMKPTSSSHAKKELFPVSLRNTSSPSSSSSISNSKNLTKKFSSASKASYVSSKKSAKALTRSSSLSLVRSLTKTTSFKASNRACPRKSARATCSSTLKDSKFPAYLMLTPGGTESEGTSAMKVCPYTYCSLNGHCHDALPPLKSFVSARRRLLKTQKSMRLDALSPRREKVLRDTKKDSAAEQNAFDANAAYDEIDMDVFIEIYAKERESNPTGADQMGNIDFVKEIEGSVKQVESEIGLEEDHKKSFDYVSVEVDTKGIILHEEISMGSYCSDGSGDGENMKDVEMDDDDSDSKGTEMEWKVQQLLCEFEHEEDVESSSSVSSEEDTDSKFESLSVNSHNVSVTWLDDILTRESNAEESNFFEEQHPIGSVMDGTSGTCNVSVSSNEENKVQMFDVTEDSTMEVQEQGLWEKYQGKANKLENTTRGEDQNGGKKGVIRHKKPPVEDDEDEMRKFNPREPNYLPLVPEAEPEKVGLRHQMMDERKDAEQWMLDCALRQAVTKLAPARKKKVALLVEAFETVMPIHTCETQLRNNSATIQACT